MDFFLAALEENENSLPVTLAFNYNLPAPKGFVKYFQVRMNGRGFLKERLDKEDRIKEAQYQQSVVVG